MPDSLAMVDIGLLCSRSNTSFIPLVLLVKFLEMIALLGSEDPLRWEAGSYPKEKQDHRNIVQTYRALGPVVHPGVHFSFCLHADLVKWGQLLSTCPQ